MSSKNRSRKSRSRGFARNLFSRGAISRSSIDRAMDWKRGRQLRHEGLEDRWLLTVFSNNSSITINDDAIASPYPSTINASLPQGVTADVLDVNVSLSNLTHTFPGDLDVVVEGPTGASVLLMSDAGDSNAVAGVSLTFSDGEPNLPENGQIVSGTFAPTNFGAGDTFPAPAPGAPSSVLSVFDGVDPAGDWNLFVIDDAATGTGTIANGWSVNVTLGGDVLIDAGPDADDGTGDIFDVTLSGGGNNLLVSVDGNTVFNEPFAGVTSLTINGSGDDDQLILDTTNGVPIPAGTNGLVFNGGAQTLSDSIILNGSNVLTDVDYNFTNANDGTIEIDGATLTYNGLEPITDNVTAVNRGFTFATPTTGIQLTSAGALLTRIDSPVSELVNFNTPTNSLTINLADGVNEVDIVSLAGNYNTPNNTINGGTGSDTFFLSPDPTVPWTINGNLPTTNPGDKIVLNNAPGATVNPPGSPDGVITTPGRQPISFTNIEAIVIPDRFEANNSIATASVLGSLPEITLRDLSIDSDTDLDFFRYTANDTGKLIINALFEHAVGDLDLQVQDSAGNVIASSASPTDNEQIIIPVVSQERYYIRVNGFGTDTNNYELEIENFEAPAPTFVDLASASDTGASQTDNLTADTTPTFFIQADLSDLQDDGITLLNQPAIDVNNDGDASDAINDGAGVYVSLISLVTGNQVEGFANQVGVSGLLWSFTPNCSAAKHW